MQQEIDKVREAQLAGYARGGATEEKVQLNLTALAALDAADFSANNSDGECFGSPRPTPTRRLFFVRPPPPFLGGRDVRGGTRTE